MTKQGVSLLCHLFGSFHSSTYISPDVWRRDFELANFIKGLLWVATFILVFCMCCLELNWCSVLYVDEIRWKEKMDAEHADMYEAIKGYDVNNECIEKETMCYLSMVWSDRQRSELNRLV